MDDGVRIDGGDIPHVAGCAGDVCAGLPDETFRYPSIGKKAGIGSERKNKRIKKGG